VTNPPPPPPGNYPPPPPPPPGGGYEPPPPPPPGGGYDPPPPPPPPGGGYPPAPAAQGGYAPPPVGAPGYGPGPETFTPWGTRAIAGLIDFALPLAIGLGLGWGILLGTQETACITDASEYDLGQYCATGASTIGQLSVVLFPLLAVLFILWNSGFKQGNTGQSIGKGIMKFKVVGEDTGQPIGAGKSILRELVYVVAYGICGIVWLVAILFPLWDPKRQTLVDKLFTTVALPA
jgi:uncharacterized RDD family membrane protein YckC